jgi:serine/threonine protein kinase
LTKTQKGDCAVAKQWHNPPSGFWFIKVKDVSIAVIEPNCYAASKALPAIAMLHVQQQLQNRYQLLRQLGQTASRQTWLAHDSLTQESVVVKLLACTDQAQWDDLKLFQREAQVLQHLDHPQIPRYRDAFNVDDQMLWLALVQEYIAAPNLKERLEQGELFTESEAKQVARAVLNILTYLHKLSPPVIHRDIKPSNLLQGEDHQIYLVDFGAVQDRAAAAGATFTVVGTYGYAPLEQLGGRAVPASDLYALGATLIHLLTGIPPADLVLQQGRSHFADYVTLNPGFTRWLTRLTEPNLARRFTTAEQALTALDRLETTEGAALSSPVYSPIRLDKTAHQVRIVIPGEMNPYHLISFLFVCTSFSVGIFSILGPSLGIWVLTLGELGLGLGLVIESPWFSKTHLRLDHHQFTIELRVCGLCLWRQQGSVADIDQILQRAYTLDSNKGHEIVLVAGIREYPLRRIMVPLTLSESQWLITELKQWLGLVH